jgi:energy-converting hydrogenase Eha subunit E
MRTADKKSKYGAVGSKNPLKKIVLLTVFSGVLLLITNSAIWLNKQIFDAEKFTQIVTTSINSESSRTAIAQNITDDIFVDRPISKRIAGDFSVKIISGLLNTSQFNNVLNAAIQQMHVYATSNNQADVVIELGAVKDILLQLATISESLGRDVTIDTNKIPDQIVLIEETDIPDLYSATVVMLWIAPISLVFALILLIYPYLKKIADYKDILLIQGLFITVTSFIGYLIGPLFRPPVLSQVNVENRVVIGNLYDTFIASFNSQTLILTLIGVSMALLASAINFYPRFKKTLHKQ